MHQPTTSIHGPNYLVEVLRKFSDFRQVFPLN